MFGLLLLAFVVVPMVELWVVIQVADGIGIPETLALLLLISLAGAVLVRFQGWGAVRRVQEAVTRGSLPTNELVDGALIMVAAALLLTPGFVTDAVGFALLIPPSRALVRRGLIAYFRSRVARPGFGPSRSSRRWGVVIDVDEPAGDTGAADPRPPTDPNRGPIELGP